MSGEEPDAVTRLQVPQTTCFVRRSAGQVSTVVMKFHTVHILEVPCKYPQGKSILKVPESGRAVMGTCRKVVALRTDVQAPHGKVMTFVCDYVGVRMKTPQAN